MWPTTNYGLSDHITGTAEPKVVKIFTQVGYINASNRMTYQPQTGPGYGHMTVLEFCRLPWCSAWRGFFSDILHCLMFRHLMPCFTCWLAVVTARNGDFRNVCIELQLAHIDWNSTRIGWLHAIFYVGLLLSQMPCGYIVTKLPSHWYAHTHMHADAYSHYFDVIWRR